MAAIQIEQSATDEAKVGIETRVGEIESKWNITWVYR